MSVTYPGKMDDTLLKPRGESYQIFEIFTIGCQVRGRIVIYLYFLSHFQTKNNRTIELLNNTKKLLSRIVSVAPKLTINDWA